MCTYIGVNCSHFVVHVRMGSELSVIATGGVICVVVASRCPNL